MTLVTLSGFISAGTDWEKLLQKTLTHKTGALDDPAGSRVLELGLWVGLEMDTSKSMMPWVWPSVKQTKTHLPWDFHQTLTPQPACVSRFDNSWNDKQLKQQNAQV